MKKNIFFLVFVFLCIINSRLCAQSKAYNKISIDLGSSVSIVQNSFTRNWAPKPSLNLESRISFYTGDVQFGFRLTRFDYTDPHFPGGDFYSTFIYLGWEYPFHITHRLSIAPGLRFGIKTFTFDKAKVYTKPDRNYNYTFDSQESEFAYELMGRLEYKIGQGSWSVYTAFSYNRTSTHHPLPLSVISAGVSHHFTTPSWLKRFLK